jgi:hypothetical protein
VIVSFKSTAHPYLAQWILAFSFVAAQIGKKMESASKPTPSSDEAVPKTMQQGLETMVVQAGIGLVVGGMAGVVLARGGASGARRVMAGFGAGVGAGSAWTRCSIDLEDLLNSK